MPDGRELTDELGIAELSTEMSQSQGQVRRYFDARVYFVHRFAGTNGQAKHSMLGSAKVRVKAKGLLEKRLQKTVTLRDLGNYYRQVCGEDDAYVTQRIADGKSVDTVAQELAAEVYEHFFKREVA